MIFGDESTSLELLHVITGICCDVVDHNNDPSSPMIGLRYDEVLSRIS